MKEPRPVTRSGLIQSHLEAVGREDDVPLAVIAPGPELLPLRDLARSLPGSSGTTPPAPCTTPPFRAIRNLSVR